MKEQPIEAGRDYISRKFHFFYVSTLDYDRKQLEPEDIPDELPRMRAELQKIRPGNDQERLIVEALSHRIIEPNGVTFFSHDESRFIILEPRLDPALLDAWKALGEG